MESAQPTFSVLVISFKRPEETLALVGSLMKSRRADVEFLVWDNDPEEATRRALAGVSDGRLRVLGERENHGVAEGRNRVTAQARGRFFVYLDDDADCEVEELLEAMERTFASDPRIGIIACRILRFADRTMNRIEYPFRNKNRDPLKAGTTATFIGAGHAIRRVTWEEAGAYPKDFFYGMEEVDLSVRALAKGWLIYYQPACVVLHKRSPGGRASDVRNCTLSLRNRMFITWSYFGPGYAGLSWVLWSARYLLYTGSLRPSIDGLQMFLATVKGLQPRRLDPTERRRLRQARGRVIF